MTQPSFSGLQNAIPIHGHHIAGAPLPEAVRNLAHLLAQVAVDQWLAAQQEQVRDCPLTLMKE